MASNDNCTRCGSTGWVFIGGYINAGADEVVRCSGCSDFGIKPVKTENSAVSEGTKKSEFDSAEWFKKQREKLGF
jgi:hypothetical protein